MPFHEALAPSRPVAKSQPAAPKRHIDACVAGQDGFLWPLDRKHMMTSDAIRGRMAEDMKAHLHEHGEDAVCDADDLIRLGWTMPQIAAHGVAAVRTFEVDRAKAQSWRDSF